MEKIDYWNNFSKKYNWAARKQIQREKEPFVNSLPELRTLAIQNKEWFKQVYLEYLKSWKVDLKTILSPLYNNDWTLSSSEYYFSKRSNWLEERIQKKVYLASEIIIFLKNYFSFEVEFIVADSGLLLPNSSININEIDENINISLDIFSGRLTDLLWNDDFKISKMSDMWIGIERVRDMTYNPTLDDCMNLIKQNAINPEIMMKWLQEIIWIYWITVAYYEIESYFKESKFIWDNFSKNIILNIEWSSLWNKKFVKWKNNMTIERENWNWWNLLVWAVIQ